MQTENKIETNRQLAKILKNDSWAREYFSKTIGCFEIIELCRECGIINDNQYCNNFREAIYLMRISLDDEETTIRLLEEYTTPLKEKLDELNSRKEKRDEKRYRKYIV